MNVTNPRVLFLMPTKTYRARMFLEAANKLDLNAVIGSERKQALEAFTPGRTLTINFFDPETARRTIVDFARQHPLDAIIPVDDDTAVIAAMASRALSLPANSPESVRATREKHRLKQALSRAGQPVPTFQMFSTDEQPEDIAGSVPYPCVLKPVFLAASRGVIRANDTSEFVCAFNRVKTLMSDTELKKRGGPAARQILVEEYVQGTEFALEGILTHGNLKVLAIFDKPDPLEGPFFEETIYVTPSRLSPEDQTQVIDCVDRAARAIGLQHGPVHAEIRLNEHGPWLIEIAARSIGGLCSRSLRFDHDISLEELTLRHALGMDIQSLKREKLAAGVMMLPIPKPGILKDVQGLEQAKTVPRVEDVNITIALEQKLTPLPEGDRYLGFIFARAPHAEEVEDAIREAYGRLGFVIEE